MSDTPSPVLTDLRIDQACSLIRTVLTERQQELTAIRPPQANWVTTYQELLETFAQVRGGGLYYPYLGTGLGKGALVELADGSVKYDMITGIGVHVFGHGNPEIAELQVRAALSDTIMQGNLQQNVDTVALSIRLVELARRSGAAVEHCFLSTSGAMANENALKMLFQAKYPADRLLTFSNSFAGRTLALSQVTDRPQNREGLPTTLAVDYIPFFQQADPEKSIRHSVSVLKKLIARYPGQHAGFMGELIQGEGGYYTAPREFFTALFDVLREQQIPIFVDEIQTFGRTERPFAFQTFELDEYVDVVSLGKMSQVCATLFTPALRARPGLISQTFTGATVTIHAAGYVLDQLERLSQTGRITQIHQRFGEHFERMAVEKPGRISGPWGYGGMIAMTIGDGAADVTKTFLKQLYEAGVIAFAAGAEPTRVRMLPPLMVIEDAEIDAVCEVIEQVL